MDAISSMEFDYVASGHYANVVHSSADHKDKPSVKDQMYFLSHLSQAQLRRLIFHLEEVRKLATKFDLRNKDKKDSWGICFLGKTHWVVEGIILEAETGDFLEKHRGFWFYTIGQHQELGLLYIVYRYVVEKDIENNIVFVSRNYYSFDKKRHLFHAGSLKLLSGLPPEKISQLHSVFYNCSLTIEHCEDGGEDIAVVQLSEDDQGLAAGQFAAFYQGRRCLGSGVILEAWDDQGFPVCKKALEIARMEDKSKLGKPVKIKVKLQTPMEFDNNKGIESSRNLFNGQNGVVENRNTTSQVQEEAIPRFPGNWMHKLSEKWTHCVAGIKFAFDEMPIFDV
ncbi:tRNA-5-taurinomethyluridine 2-sulfurtransferase [Citrus sinensis]|nr:tRNA-5-taurinomethyluridine 2-sulfurtransferase [Citrus sinensis]